MQEKLYENTCAQFAAQLASKAPVPGGGGAAALIGALAAALGAMAARLTVGKKKYLQFRPYGPSPVVTTPLKDVCHPPPPASPRPKHTCTRPWLILLPAS